MSLRKIIDNFGISLENLGRNISGKNKSVRREYIPKEEGGMNRNVKCYNKYGEQISETGLRVFQYNG